MASEALVLVGAKVEKQQRRHPRGVFQKVPGRYSPGDICYWDAQGRRRREKAGTKSAAIELYHTRKLEAFEGKKLPEKLRRATVSFAEIAQDALAYSKANKMSPDDNESRMVTPLGWFREYPAESITAQDIERRFEQKDWSPATMIAPVRFSRSPTGLPFVTSRSKRTLRDS